MIRTMAILSAAGAAMAAGSPRTALRDALLEPVSEPTVTCSAAPGEWHEIDGSKLESYADLEAALAELDESFPRESLSWSFDCDASGGRSATPPTSVHKLRPGDIDFVAAMGDSITAAYGAGAGSIFTDWIEYRGLSFSIGGDKALDNGVFTLPNVLRQFNPAVQGMSTGTYTKLFGGNKEANRAVSGARASDLPPQAREVVDYMKDKAKNDDWKMVTLFIGGNDLCGDSCKNEPNALPENYAGFIRQTLTTLMEMSNVFVNLVQTVDVTKLYDVKGPVCSLLHGFECGCGASSDETTRAGVTATAKKYWQKVEDIAADSSFARDDFAVVVQPFFTEIELPTCSDGSPDKSFFAPDCFHFSEKGHQASAEALWNSLLEPVGSKKTSWVIGEGIECPTSDKPYLRTAQN